MVTAIAKRSRGGLSKYDPDKGLKTIAVAEAAEKHFARAKDATKLKEAIRAKLEAQADFVSWWDGHVEKQQGARGDRRSNERRSRIWPNDPIPCDLATVQQFVRDWFRWADDQPVPLIGGARRTTTVRESVAWTAAWQKRRTG